MKGESMNTPSNAGKEHNPDGLLEMDRFRFLCIGEPILKGDEYWDRCAKRWFASVNWRKYDKVSELGFVYRRRTTPPTQSQEGGTPSRVSCVGDGTTPCGYVGGKSGFQCPKCGGMLLSETAQLEANRMTIGVLGTAAELFKQELTAAQRENDRLRKLIEDAPHDVGCGDYLTKSLGINPALPCDCWKSRAATEEGK